MRVRRGLLASVLVGVFGAGVQSALVAVPVAVTVAVRLRAAFDPVPSAVVATCPADPAAFRADGPAWSAWAYDDTFSSRHPEALPVPWTARVRLGHGEDEAAAFVPWSPGGGAVVWRTGLDGPCTWIGLHWRGTPGGRASLAVALAASGTVVVVLALVVAATLVDGPLRRQVRALVEAAPGFGTPGWRQPAVGGELAPVATLLDEAHRRVVAEREAEVAGRTALERHLADVAHDLRTPLASLQLRLEALSNTDPLVAEALSDVVSLALLTDNLQLAARLREAPVREPPSIDLGAVVERVRARFRLLGPRWRVDVDGAVPAAPVWVRVEEVLAEQVVVNLVHNAVHHHPGDGHVAIVLSAAAGRFEVRVQDDGRGLSEAARATLLGGPAGRGRGLRIVADACRRAGWSVDVAADEGTTVSVRGAAELSGSRGPP